MALGSHVEDFPFACREGQYGSDQLVATQLNPECVGPCPPGKICAGATHTPQPCTVGSYCPRGSAAGQHGQSSTLGRASALPLHPLGAHLVAQCSPALPGWPPATGIQPQPQVLELATFKVADLTGFDSSGRDLLPARVRRPLHQPHQKGGVRRVPRGPLLRGRLCDPVRALLLQSLNRAVLARGVPLVPAQHDDNELRCHLGERLPVHQGLLQP